MKYRKTASFEGRKTGEPGIREPGNPGTRDAGKPGGRETEGAGFGRGADGTATGKTWGPGGREGEAEGTAGVRMRRGG